jgi:hypothetical protein
VTYLLTLYLFVVCIFSAWIGHQIRINNLPFYCTLITSGLISLGWMFGMKYSKLGMVQLGALADVAAGLGYFTGLLLIGIPITKIQLLGIFFTILGLYFINK